MNHPSKTLLAKPPKAIHKLLSPHWLSIPKKCLQCLFIAESVIGAVHTTAPIDFDLCFNGAVLPPIEHRSSTIYHLVTPQEFTLTAPFTHKPVERATQSGFFFLQYSDWVPLSNHSIHHSIDQCALRFELAILVPRSSQPVALWELSSENPIDKLAEYVTDPERLYF